MPKETLLDRVLVTIDELLPKKVETWGSALVRRTLLAEDGNGEYVILEKGGGDKRPFVIAPKGTFCVGKRLELIRVRRLGPQEWLFKGEDRSSYNEYFARQWDPQKMGKDLTNRGFKIIDVDHVLDGQHEVGEMDFRRRSDGAS